MQGGGSNRRPAVKVVIINTQYVETDSTSFKSVVQRLTGKDAIVEVKHSPPVVVEDSNHKQIMGAGGGGGGEVARSTSSNSVLLRGLSFKDFDKFLMELPSSFDEIFQMIMD